MADACRLCAHPLRQLTRVPVCSACLENLSPLAGVPLCDRCGVPFASASAGPTCGECRLHSPAYTRAAAFGVYQGGLRQLIHLLKYSRMRPLAEPLGRRLAQTLADSAIARPDVIVPVPLHRRRQLSRGFNQAGLLAKSLARLSGVPCAPRVLRRVRSTLPQAGLSASARKDNLARAFRAGHAETIAGKRVLLIDDVLTTGATAHACARTLRRAGAAEVAVLTLARAVPMEVQS